MFNDHTFSKWLDKKVELILSKADKESLSEIDLLTLVLKAQTNHFNHLDVEMREDFQRLEKSVSRIDHDLRRDISRLEVSMNDRFDKVDQRFENIDKRFENIDKRFENIDQRFENIDQRFIGIDQRFVSIDQRFVIIDHHFERLDKKIDDRFMWTIGLMVTGFAGIYLKLFWH